MFLHEELSHQSICQLKLDMRGARPSLSNTVVLKYTTGARDLQC